MRAGGRGIPGMTHSLEPGEVGKVWLSGSPGSVWGRHSCCLFRGVFPLSSLRLSIFIMPYGLLHQHKFFLWVSLHVTFSSCLDCPPSFSSTWKTHPFSYRISSHTPSPFAGRLPASVMEPFFPSMQLRCTCKNINPKQIGKQDFERVNS